jgi:hypothetical protein
MLAAMNSTRWISPLLVLAITALAAGCGGGPQAVSSAELVQKGDEICAHARDQFAKVQAEPPANASEAADQTQQLVDVTHDELTSLRDLEPPDEQRAAYNRYLEAFQRADDLFKQGKEAADNQNGDGYATAQAAVAAGAKKRQQLAQALGFKDCSKVSLPTG